MNLWGQTSARCTFPTSGAARAATTASSPRNASSRTGHGHSTSTSSSLTGNQSRSRSPSPCWNRWPEGWARKPRHGHLPQQPLDAGGQHGSLEEKGHSCSSSQEVGMEEQHTPRELSVKLYEPSLLPFGATWLPVCVRDSWNTTWVSLRDG